MKITNIVRSLMSILILTLVLHPAWGTETVESVENVVEDEKAPKKGMAPVEELDGVLSLQIKALLGKELAKKDRELEEKLTAQKKEHEAKLAAQKKDLLEQLAAQKKEFDAGLKSQIEHISKVIKQEPPSFVQRITPNKYIWAVSGLTLLSVTVSFAHHCDGFWSIPYATWMSAAENLPLLINLYYGAKIVQESTSVKGILASQAAQ